MPSGWSFVGCFAAKGFVRDQLKNTKNYSTLFILHLGKTESSRSKTWSKNSERTPLTRQHALTRQILLMRTWDTLCISVCAILDMSYPEEPLMAHPQVMFYWYLHQAVYVLYLGKTDSSRSKTQLLNSGRTPLSRQRIDGGSKYRWYELGIYFPIGIWAILERVADNPSLHAPWKNRKFSIENSVTKCCMNATFSSAYCSRVKISLRRTWETLCERDNEADDGRVAGLDADLKESIGCNFNCGWHPIVHVYKQSRAERMKVQKLISKEY